MQTQRGFASAAVLIAIVLAVVILGGAYFVMHSQLPSQTLSETKKTSLPQPQTSKLGWKIYNDTGFEVQYPGSTFVLFPITTNLLDDTLYNGVKLISLARASEIGQPGCMYGESGIRTICSATGEAGIAFIPINDSVQNLTSSLTGITTVTILGKQSVKYSYGAEGDGTDIYYIPLSSNQSLVIKRTYRDVDGDFPQQTLFDQVVATLVIK